MPLEQMKNLINRRAHSAEPISRDSNAVVSSNPIECEKKNKLVCVVRKLLVDVSSLGNNLLEVQAKLDKFNSDMEGVLNNKVDTQNLKSNYKQFVEDTNANTGLLNEKIKFLMEENKKLNDKLIELNSKLNELEDF